MVARSPTLSPSRETLASSPAETLLALLRRETAACHQDVDRGSPLHEGALEREDVHAYLLRIRPWVRQIDALVWSHWLARESDLEPLQRACKTAWIDTDFPKAAGVAHTDTQTTSGLFLRSKSEAWGAAYVVEGMTLGGRVIDRRLRERGIALRFFRGYEEDNTERWRSFANALCKQPSHGASAAAVIAGARRAFESFPYGENRD